MKKSLLAFSILVSVTATAQQANLIVEKVENGGQVPGQTYRVWAHLENPSHTLHLVWGDVQNPLEISSTAPFYQHALGNQSSLGMNETVINLQPSLAFDSYITVGYDRSGGNNLWELGVDFTSFNQGGQISATNGAWFLLPADQKCTPVQNGLVLIGQFTTTGVASGTMNLQGWEAPQQPWRVRAATFVTTDAKVFGCMNADAANFNPNATFDNGTCDGIATSNTPAVALKPAASNEEMGWDVFPNPVRESLVHVQFRNAVMDSEKPARIDIIDMNGKLVGSHTVSAGAMLPGNRMTLDQDLAQGTYRVMLIQNGTIESKTIIVQR